MRMYVCSILVAAVLVLSGCGSNETESGQEQQNIVFIFSDDHAYQAIGAYGSKLNKTPNIDRLASEGMRFDRAMVTNSICAPSRAVILTGKYSHLNGLRDNRVSFDGSQQTFPKLLQQAGYQTAIVGKWHLKSDPTGFDYWQVLPGQGAYYNPDMKDNGTDVQHTGYTTDILTDIALDWLKTKRDPQKPFILMLQNKAPHREWQPGPEHLTLYDDVEMPEPETLFDDYANRASPARNQEMEIARHMTLDSDLKVPPGPDADAQAMKRWARTYGRLNEEQRKVWDAAYGPKNDAFLKANLTGKDLVRWKYQRYIKDYLRCIASVDDNVGRVLDYLDQTGLAKNTVVIYSSDQGFYLGEHGWFDKRWIYEESLRTPLIVRWPGVTAPGSANKEMVANVDYPETFLDIAGVPIPADMQGRSLTPLLKGQTPSDWRQSFYYQYHEQGVHAVAPHYGVVTPRYKLVHFYGTDEWELFDRDMDPQEMKSVYGQADYADVQDQLSDELRRLQADLQVPAGDLTMAPTEGQ